MFVSDCLGLNSQGHLTIGGVDTLELAETYGTPVYVMDEDQIRRNCRKFKDSIDRYYEGRGLCCYASKAFSCKEIYRIVESEGLGADIVSLGELHTALSAGFPAERICYHGNNKTPAELAAVIEHRVGRVVIDNLTELELLDRMAQAAGVTVRVMFRVKPGVEAHTHEYIQTGQIDSKFGLALETGEAMEATRRVLQMHHLQLTGMHCHIGSQIFDNEPFAHTARVMMQFYADIKRETGYLLDEFNIGGGHGIMYTAADTPSPFETFMADVSRTVVGEADRLGLKRPFVLMEPGRAIVGEAGITLYTVGAVKEIPGIRTYASIDGGMTDNPRYALYQSRYTALAAARAGEPADHTFTLAGRCCETGDLIGKDLPMQALQPGDVVAVLSTGAYNYSMASNYNRVPRPPVVMVRAGQSRVVVRRESLDDLIRNDI